MSHNSLSYQRAFQFALRIVETQKSLSCYDSTLAQNLLLAGTTIGAKLARVKDRHFTPDSYPEVSLAVQQCQETKYWLSLLKEQGEIDDKTFNDLVKEADEITQLLNGILDNLHPSQRN